MTRASPPARDDAQISVSHTLRDALAIMAARLAHIGIDEAARDARYLLQGILGVDASDVLREPGRIVGEHAALLEAAVRRRLSREPVSRILGMRDFYGRSFKVTPDVLDPRADTETLIDLVLDVARREPQLNGPITIADIGSGSGAIIVTLLAELKSARGLAIDVSAAALEVTMDNAQALGVVERLTALETRGLAGVAGRIDLIVSNPPYIATDDITQLDAEVRQFDPTLALDGGVDGLAVYTEIVNDIKRLRQNCWVFLEFGAGQYADVTRLFSNLPVGRHEARADLGGHIRAVALEIHW